MPSKVKKQKNKNENVSLLMKQMLRKATGARSNCPIVIVKGDGPPALKGKGYYWTNKRGDVIRHPNAYKQAWGKPIYNPSTIRVEVGSNWLLNNLTTKNIRDIRLKVFE